MCQWLRERRELLRSARANLVVLALFVAFSFVGFSLLNNAFVRNEEQSILSYSHYCASEIEGGLSVYGTLVDFGTRSLADALHAGEAPDAYLDWIEMYGERMRAALDDEAVTLHAVVEGCPLEVGGWSGTAAAEDGDRAWLAAALAHSGEVVYTDIHDDEVAGGHVVTIAQASADGDVAFAVDILPERLSSHFDLLEIEGEDSLYVCDSSGTPLYMRSALETYDERQMFLEEIGLEESGVSRLIKSAYALLDLETFFTAGEMEVKAWTYHKGWKAPQCAGVIHTDFEKGFIRAEVIKYDDYIVYGSEAAVREAGKLNVEGKDYVVEDGDIMHFRFNV